MKLEHKRYYSCDFETSTDKWLERDNNVARIWAWASYEIEETFSNFEYGNNMYSFMGFVKSLNNGSHIFFHNLKFDGEYIINHLLANGWKYIEDKKDKKCFTFNTLISDTGELYKIELWFYHLSKHLKHITISDSLKIIPGTVEKIAKDYGIEETKLKIDYDEYRPVGHELTPLEVDYIHNDVLIIAKVMYEFIKGKFNKITIASNALQNYKDHCGFKFNKVFPILDDEAYLDIRKSYKGGFCYVNPINQDKIVNGIVVFDVNSLYPSVLLNELLPYDKPLLFKGEYKEDKEYPLYIQKLSCSFKLKEGKIPTIQLRHTLRYSENEYLTTSNGMIESLTLTNIDLKLFLENYDVKDIYYEYGYKFKGKHGLFDNYINYWGNQKIEATIEKNKSKRQIAKLMMNSLYGKYACSNKNGIKRPYIDDEGILRYIINEDDSKTIYIPIATFTTAYARNKTIRTSQAFRDWGLEKYGYDPYIYSDTDSIHANIKYQIIDDKIVLEDKELYDIIDISDTILGYWKIESVADRGKFLRQKCYIEEYKGKVNATVCGMPKQLGKYITFDNFKIGFTISKDDLSKEHKLTYKHVKGGVVLTNTDFTIKSTLKRGDDNDKYIQ